MRRRTLFSLALLTVLGAAGLALAHRPALAQEEPTEQADGSPDSALVTTIQQQTLACGATTSEIFKNDKSSNVNAGFRVSCDCGEGAYVVISTWGDNITEKENCKVESGKGTVRCAFDIPAGAKVSVACNNDSVSEDQRKGAGCTYSGKIES